MKKIGSFHFVKEHRDFKKSGCIYESAKIHMDSKKVSFGSLAYFIILQMNIKIFREIDD